MTTIGQIDTFIEKIIGVPFDYTPQLIIAVLGLFTYIYLKGSTKRYVIIALMFTSVFVWFRQTKYFILIIVVMLIFVKSINKYLMRNLR